MTRAWRRLHGGGRVAGVDLARGLAVIGMLAAHLLWLPEWSWTDPASWADIANGRSSILFATLAGVSLALVTGGTRTISPGALRTARGRIAVRALVIWTFGMVLVGTGVPVYVILPAYAVLFLMALPLLRLRAGALAVLAAVLALVTPFLYAGIQALPLIATPEGELIALVVGWHYPFVVWITFIVAGLVVGRLPLRRVGVQVWLLLVGAALAAIGYGLAGAGAGAGEAEGVGLSEPWAAVFTTEAHSSGLYEVIGSGGFAIAVIGACLLLCRTPVTWLALPLRAVGSMPLTAYVAQLVAWTIWAGIALGEVGDLGGFRELDPFWPITIGVIAGCTAWALLIGRGPLEWVTDRLARLAVTARA